MKTIKTSLLFLLAASVAFAADPTIMKEATGQAAVAKPGEEARAIEDAKQQALRSAVEQAAGVLITSDTTTLNSVLIRDQVYSRASGYVRSYEVVGKPRVEKGVASVTVKAEIITADLDKDLQAVKGLISRLGRNKLIIVTQEQAIDDKGVASKSETLAAAVTEAFKKDGWNVLDEKGGGDLKLAAGVAQGMPAVKEIMKTTDADYVVYGTINFRYHIMTFGGVDKDGNPQVFPVTAEYDLAMFNVKSREQLAKIAGKFSQMDIKATKGVNTVISYTRTATDLCNIEAPKIISQLRAPVIEYLRNKSVNGNDVVLKVSGLPDIGAVDDFSDSVKTMKDVSQVKQNGDFENGTMQYTVTTTGSAMDFGKALGKSKYKAKALKVTAVRENAVEVAIAK